jgi:hypothetical protein
LIIRNFLLGIFLVLGLLGGSAARASDSDVSPLEVGLFPPLQLPNSDYGVRGLRFTVVGVNREAIGIDLAVLGNVTNTTFKGTAISGLFNYNRGGSTVIGFQVAALANLNTGHSEVYGIQIGGYNQAGTVHGLQLGLINVATELHGVQIGLFNMNKNGPFHASPIINAAF